MMADFETALELARHAQSDEAAALREEGFRRQDERIEKRAEQTKEEQSETSTLLTAILAGGDTKYAIRLKELDDRVGLHQTAVIEALLENQERLDAIQLRLDEVLSEAYVLPDGRRVFKSEDGVRVFDEHGAQLATSEFDADMIPEHHPSWELFRGTRDAKIALTEQREELMEYQDRLDHAQTLIDQGGLTDDDFADLDDLITNDVPDAVRARLPTTDPAYRAEPSAENSANAEFGPDGLDIAGPTTSGLGFK